MSLLPTPPHTVLRFSTAATEIQHPISDSRIHDKENIPPVLSPTLKTNYPPSPPKSSPLQPAKKLQLRSTRVVFSHSNRHHPYAHTVRAIPSSKMTEPPKKSNLRRSTETFAFAEQLKEEKQREATPEPEQPLESEDFLFSPINVIVSSLGAVEGRIIEPSLRDLDVAYKTLGDRLRTHFKSSGEEVVRTDLPALKPLRENEARLAEAFVRDLARLLAEPVINSSDEESSALDISSSSADEAPKAVDGEPKPKRRGMTAMQILHGQDLFCLGLTSVKTLAAVMSGKALYSSFSETSLRSMVSAYLDVLLAETLYVPNSRKITMNIIAGLQSLRVPVSVIEPLAERFILALERALDGLLGREGKKGAGCEALTTIHILCRLYPSIFLPRISSLVWPVLQRCVPGSPYPVAMTTRAASAVGGIALGVLNWSRLEPQSQELQKTKQQLALRVKHFFSDKVAASNTPESSKKAKKTTPSAPLMEALETAMKEAEVESTTEAFGLQWAVSILASIIALLREDIHTCPNALRLVLRCLAPAVDQKSRLPQRVKMAARLAWATLLWSAGMDPEDDGAGKESVWKPILSVKAAPVPTCMAATLLNAENLSVESRDLRIRIVLRYLRDALDEGQVTAINVLASLVSPLPEMPLAWNPDDAIARELLDGSFMNYDKKASLVVLARDIMNNKVSPTFLEGEDAASSVTGMVISDCIRPLADHEVLKYIKAIWTIYRTIVGKVSFGQTSEGSERSFGEAPPVLFKIWKDTLRRVSGFLTREDVAETTKSRMIGELSDILGDYVVAMIPSEKDEYPKGVEEADKPLVAVSFVAKLWEIARDILGPFVNQPGDTAKNYIEGVPGALVEKLLSPEDFDLDLKEDKTQQAVRIFDVWSGLLANVLSNAPSKCLTQICQGLLWDDGPTRMVWSVIAKQVISEDEWQGWTTEEGLSVLAVPFSEICDGPISIPFEWWFTWDGLLDRVCRKADEEGQGTEFVLQKVAEMLNNSGDISVETSIRAAMALVQRTVFPASASAYSPGCKTQTPEFDPESLGSELASVLAVVSNILTTVRPSQLQEFGEMDATIAFIDEMSALIKRVPACLSTLVLQALQDGLCAWLAPSPESERTEFEVNYYAQILNWYVAATLALQSATPSVQTLEILQRFLISVFENSTEEARGPKIFLKFWVENYEELYATEALPYPELLKPVLRALRRLSEEVQADGLSYGTDSTPSLDNASNGSVSSPVSPLTDDVIPSTEYVTDISNSAHPSIALAEDPFEIDGAPLTILPAALLAPVPRTPSPKVSLLQELLDSAAKSHRKSEDEVIPDSASEANTTADTETSWVAISEPLVDGSRTTSITVDASFEEFINYSNEEVPAGSLAAVGSDSDFRGTGDVTFSLENAEAVVPDSTEIVEEPLLAPLLEAAATLGTPEKHVEVNTPIVAEADLSVVPDSQEHQQHMDMDEEELDALLVESSLELEVPATPSIEKNMEATQSHSTTQKRRMDVDDITPPKRARTVLFQSEQRTRRSSNSDHDVVRPNYLLRSFSESTARTPRRSDRKAKTNDKKVALEVKAPSKGRRLFLDAVVVPTAASLGLPPPPRAADLVRHAWNVLTRKPSAPMIVENDVFGAPGPLTANALRSLQPSSSAVVDQVLVPGMPSSDGAPQDVDTIATDQGNVDPEATESPVSEDLPANFDGVIMSSGLRRDAKKVADDSMIVTPTNARIESRLNRTNSEPASSPSLPFRQGPMRTQSLSAVATVEKHLEVALKARAQLSVAELRQVSSMLMEIQRQVEEEIVSKTRASSPILPEDD